MGPLQDKVTNETKLIHVEDGKVKFNDMEFPMNPMIGVIGVAPKEGAIPCGMPGAHGGNLDNMLIKTGARLYFPDHGEGAIFQCGDLHAALGDGDISVDVVELAVTVEER